MRCQFEWTVSVIALLVAPPLLLTACRDSPKHYSLQGRVLGKSDSARQLTVNHGNIPGFMAAMIMPYPVRDTQGFQEVQPGDLITADIVVDGNNDYWLEHLTVKDKAGRGSVPSLAPHALLPGERGPGYTSHKSGWENHPPYQIPRQGRFTMTAFIYTRCPYPTFCPLISNEFAAIHRELAKTPQDYEEDASDKHQSRPPIRHSADHAEVWSKLPRKRSRWIRTLGLCLNQPGRSAEACSGVRT